MNHRTLKWIIDKQAASVLRRPDIANSILANYQLPLVDSVIIPMRESSVRNASDFFLSNGHGLSSEEFAGLSVSSLVKRFMEVFPHNFVDLWLRREVREVWALPEPLSFSGLPSEGLGIARTDNVVFYFCAVPAGLSQLAYELDQAWNLGQPAFSHRYQTRDSRYKDFLKELQAAGYCGAGDGEWRVMLEALNASASNRK